MIDVYIMCCLERLSVLHLSQNNALFCSHLMCEGGHAVDVIIPDIGYHQFDYNSVRVVCFIELKKHIPNPDKGSIVTVSE